MADGTAAFAAAFAEAKRRIRAMDYRWKHKVQANNLRSLPGHWVPGGQDG